MTEENHDLYLSAGTAGNEELDLEITPESAGWGYSSLRVVSVVPAGSYTFASGDDEVLVLPLEGAATVSCDGAEVELTGRAHVFAGPSDFAYVPRQHTASIRSDAGGRFALCGARTTVDLPFRYGPVGDVPVETRGAGRCSRLVRNFATTDAFEAGSIIACEVVTPGGNWSSYPAHKHDETTEREAELEEIYYFEIASGPAGEPGFGFHRTFTTPDESSREKIDLLVEVHDRDAALVPYGWHGPCAAAPGFDMYYLNVMAGPGPERAWKISDYPGHTWIRRTWENEPVDQRLVLASPTAPAKEN